MISSRLVLLFALYLVSVHCWFWSKTEEQVESPEPSSIPTPDNEEKRGPPTPDSSSVTELKKEKMVHIPGVKAEFWNNITLEEFKTDSFLYQPRPEGSNPNYGI